MREKVKNNANGKRKTDNRCQRRKKEEICMEVLDSNFGRKQEERESKSKEMQKNRRWKLKKKIGRKKETYEKKGRMRK